MGPTALSLRATVWDAGGADYNWSNQFNWDTNVEPTSSDNVFFPMPRPEGVDLIVLNSGEVAQALVFQDSYQLIGGDLTLGGTGTVTTAAGTSTLIDFVLKGSAGLTKGGAGTLSLRKHNSYTGTTSVAFGQLNLDAGGSTAGASISGTDGLIASNAGLAASAVVSGTATIWTTSGLFAVGHAGSGSLTVQAGGGISAFDSYIGRLFDSTGTAIVTDAGSTWTNSGRLYVGNLGTGTLRVLSGADVSTTDCPVGYPGSGTVEVDGVGSTLTVTDFFEIGAGGTGSMTISGGASVSSADARIGATPGGHGTVIVSGAGSTWNNSTHLTVGLSSTGELTVQAGGALSSVSNAWLGYGAGGVATATVTGAGSTWTHNGELLVGGFGTSGGGVGTLNVQAGGEVSSTNARVGNLGGAAGALNSVNVSGAGSSWTNTSKISVGNGGNGAVTVSNGGNVSTNLAVLGDVQDSRGAVTVTGAGSTWTNSGSLDVGYLGTGTLRILGGADVSTTDCFVAGGWVASGNFGNGTIEVDGVGSTLTVAGAPVIGGYGTGSMTISGGASVSSAGGVIAEWWHPPQGTVIVSGSGSTWNTNSGNLIVAWFGNGHLTVQAGGAVYSASEAWIGYGTIGVGTVTVTNPGSTWNHNGDLFLGSSIVWQNESGVGTLNVQSGGHVSSANARIGNAHGAAGPLNCVNVSGAGSSWTNTTRVSVGAGGNGAITVSNRGSVSTSLAMLGDAPDSRGTVTVTGAGSAWTSTVLVVGAAASSTGTFTVQNGGYLQTDTTMIGNWDSTTTGTMLVTGQGSTWDNLNNVNVGYNGSAGTLSIANGGSVSCWIVNLAGGSGTVGTVNVSGEGSRLMVEHPSTTNGQILMSYEGGTSVLNMTGGTVSVSGHIIDGGAGHATLTLDGGTLDMKNHNIGGATSFFEPPPHDVGPPIDVLNFRSGTLKNVKQINGGAGLTKTTAGTLTLDGTNTFTGPTTVSAGTLIFKTPYMTGSALEIADGAVAQLVRSATTPNNVVVKTGTIDTNTSGKLDVADNKLIVTAQTLLSVQAQVLAGRNGGNWDGGGIVTSMTAASAASGLTTLAVATAGSVNKTNFGDVSVSSGDVLIMYTYAGDADLTGDINGDDFFRIDQGYESAGALTGYVNGDFDYSGNIDADDYWLIDRNYHRQAMPPSPGAPAGVTSVPEPSVVSLIGVGPAALMRRRRCSFTLKRCGERRSFVNK